MATGIPSNKTLDKILFHTNEGRHKHQPNRKVSPRIVERHYEQNKIKKDFPLKG